MSLPEIVSVFAGVGGVGFGLYQYYRTKEIRQRKHRLRELSENLDDIRSRVEKAHTGFVTPLSSVDLANSLDLLSKSILAFKHETGQAPRVRVAGVTKDDFVSNKEQALEIYKKENDWVDVKLTLDSGETDYDTRMVYSINEHIFFLASGYATLHEIQENYKDILEEFDPGLYDEFEQALDTLVKESHGEIISKSNGLRIEPEKYKSVDDISESIFSQFWRYEGIEEDLGRLETLIERLEETRTAILQSSYS